ncbi:MAG TPA: BA14K family protein [Pseudolabrys sp.]|nr:BA14K family protein [Pseudolabrys sp.]
MASRTGQAGSFFFYATVALVTAGSVASGLDWLSAPLQPMAETEASVQAAKLAANVPPPGLFKPVQQVRSVYPARPLPAAPDTTPAVTAMGEPQIGTPPPAAPVQTAAPAQPKCDIAACSAAFHSFRASDCTWQPFDGPRRFCDKGQPPPQTEASAAPAAGSIVAPEPNGDQPAPKCNVDACRQAYFTFNPADCTYQPSNGPRKLCAK